jgi:hypothetical protein
VGQQQRIAIRAGIAPASINVRDCESNEPRVNSRRSRQTFGERTLPLEIRKRGGHACGASDGLDSLACRRGTRWVGRRIQHADMQVSIMSTQLLEVAVQATDNRLSAVPSRNRESDDRRAGGERRRPLGQRGQRAQESRANQYVESALQILFGSREPGLLPDPPRMPRKRVEALAQAGELEMPAIEHLGRAR